MANMIKVVGLEYARPQKNIYEDQKEGRAAFERGEAEEVEMRDLIIYALYDLHTCYVHHVQGMAYTDKRSEDIYTVLKKPDISTFTEYEFKRLFWKAVSEGKITKKGELDFIFPEEIAIALDFKGGAAINKEQTFRAKLKCKNIQFATNKTMPIIAASVAASKQEIEDAQQYISKSYLPKSGYRIRFIWVIGHIDIRIA